MAGASLGPPGNLLTFLLKGQWVEGTGVPKGVSTRPVALPGNPASSLTRLEGDKGGLAEHSQEGAGN